MTNINKHVIGSIVSPSHSVFIEGTSFIDNILFSHEILKWISMKRLSPGCSMKVDLRKTPKEIAC